jgi:hypothetical protein
MKKKYVLCCVFLCVGFLHCPYPDYIGYSGAFFHVEIFISEIEEMDVTLELKNIATDSTFNLDKTCDDTTENCIWDIRDMEEYTHTSFAIHGYFPIENADTVHIVLDTIVFKKEHEVIYLIDIGKDYNYNNPRNPYDEKVILLADYTASLSDTIYTVYYYSSTLAK